MADTEGRVLLHTEGPIATLTLNRPDKLNAIDPAMLDALEAACASLARDTSVRVVLLTGAGNRAFSVGADIDAWSSLDPLDMWRRWVRDGHRIFAAVANLPRPVIAVLNGYAFGGGLELALAADLRVAAEGIEVAQPEVKLATLPGWGGTARLPALIGASRAKRMIYTGARVGAATAERWGLVDEVAPRGEELARALELAGEIAANAPLSMQMAKSLIDEASGFGLSSGATLEALAGALAATTHDAREGIAAFRERRPPRFEGK